MTTIYLASNNAHKAEEFAALLDVPGVAVKLLSAQKIGGMPEVEENAPDFIGNARLKAMALAEKLPDAESWAMSDDSGIEVDALDGAPGVHSARYAGAHGNDAGNNEKLLASLGNLPAEKRTARFRCALVLRRLDGAEAVFDASCEGRVDFGISGENGFGYDVLFIPTGYEETFGVLDPAIKAKLSHRAAAVKQLVDWLRAGRLG